MTNVTEIQGGGPPDKISRTMHRCFSHVAALAILTLGLAVIGSAHAAGLGRLNLQSALGQPLRADLEVPSVGPDAAATLQVRLAPQSAYREANLEFNPSLIRLRLDLQSRPDGTYVVHINSAEPVNEPFLDLLLELSWSTGRLRREYTVLLDPPGLKMTPEVMGPVAAQSQPVEPPAAAAPAEAAPAAPMAAAAPAGAEARARAKTALGEESARATHQVKPGDTLGRIALENKSSSVSLDQMLVALLRTNPNSFINNNVNLMLAGRTLSIPSDSEALAIDTSKAHREVIAQSADFDAYRSRIAQAAAAAPAPVPTAPKAAVQGKVAAKVEDKGARPKSGDQLKIATAAAAPSAAAPSADETRIRQRMLEEELTRAEALKKTNEKLANELEVASKVAALAQQQASGRESARRADVRESTIEAKASAPSWPMSHWEWIAFAIVLPVLGFAIKALSKKREIEPGFFDRTRNSELGLSTFGHA